jgi:hypothetical protein
VAFSVLSGWFDNRTKYATVSSGSSGSSPGADQHTTGRTVLRKVVPSQSLTDPKNPMPWVNSVSTDIRRWKK